MLPNELDVLAPSVASKALALALGRKPEPDVNNNSGSEGVGVDDEGGGGGGVDEDLVAYKARKFSACRAPQQWQARVPRRRRCSDEVDDDEYLQPAVGCSNCSDLFPTRNELLLHRLQTHPQQPYQCVECMAAFAQAEQLDAHRGSHTRDQPHPCPHPGCARRFSLKAHVKSHTRAVHPQPREARVPAEHRCGACPNRVFQSATGLANHQSKVHRRGISDERPFVCDVCRSTFKHRYGLNRHMKNSHHAQGTLHTT